MEFSTNTQAKIISMSDSITELRDKLKQEKIQHHRLLEAYNKLLEAHGMLENKYTELCVQRYEKMTSNFKLPNPYTVYPSWLRYCGGKVESSSTSAHRGLTRGDAPGRGAGPRGVLIWRQQGYPVGPTGTSRMA